MHGFIEGVEPLRAVEGDDPIALAQIDEDGVFVHESASRCLGNRRLPWVSPVKADVPPTVAKGSRNGLSTRGLCAVPATPGGSRRSGDAFSEEPSVVAEVGFQGHTGQGQWVSGRRN